MKIKHRQGFISHPFSGSIIPYLAAIITEMARIVIMLNRLVIGGAPMDTAQLAGFLSARHQVYLVVGGKNQDELDASFLTDYYPRLHVIRIASMKRSLNILRDVRSFFITRTLLKKIKPDIIHTHGAKSGLIGRVAAASTGVKVLLHTYHGHVFHSYFSPFVSSIIVKIERLVGRFTTRIIAISESQKAELVNVYRICDAHKMTVIKLGIDADKFQDTDHSVRKNFRDTYHLSPGEIAVGIVGRIVPVKGHAFFADIVEEVKARSAQPVRFFIIGDGMLRPQLERVFREKGIDTVFFPDNPKAASVVFTSWMLNIGEAMAGLDIIALTSLNEGTPVTLLEAQAASKPVVATDVGAVREIVAEDAAGFIVSYGKVTPFADRILQLAASEELRNNMGEKGRSFVRQYHTRSQQFRAIEKLYTELLEV